MKNQRISTRNGKTLQALLSVFCVGCAFWLLRPTSKHSTVLENGPTGAANLGADDGPSWIVGDHRKPMWSQSQTFSLDDGLEPYNSLYRRLTLRKLDRGHFFQEDTNPSVDKRMVFDPRTPDDFPWDPSVQCWDEDDSPDPLAEGCFKPRAPP
eukprot:CAMPEP_0172165796 /NCGR_PEP_ID=MMETSP1050-20130122/8615_1 /TAXON_ID=233186 /ORGANISM="Cryptomonas curvata, Strain CCAP979/52" /LENGTH=152 /DNA_ID=CAMNT_0012836315 /DNA_START=100 /DNA_END=554 /DNA_ORIENTATION=+